MKQKCEHNEYSLENLLKLPKNQQADIYFGVARELFRRNQGMIAAAFMTRALTINPELLVIGSYDDYDDDDWIDM